MSDFHFTPEEIELIKYSQTENALREAYAQSIATLDTPRQSLATLAEVMLQAHMSMREAKDFERYHKMFWDGMHDLIIALIPIDTAIQEARKEADDEVDYGDLGEPCC